ncbi:NUDIX hydrolase [archaeon]|nr:NUDIX hydrolase [archaeon]
MKWAQFDSGVFLVNVLGIIYNSKTRKILIGKRINDPHIRKLSWTFPGGRPSYNEDLESCLKREVKVKTGLKIDIKTVIFAKTYPEKRKFLSIYYLCKPIGGREKAGKKFVELKWIKPSDARKYFTTSIHPRLMKYLKTLD